MEISIICAVISDNKNVITDTPTALNMPISAKYEAGTENFVIDKRLVAENFLILSTGLAYDILH